MTMRVAILAACASTLVLTQAHLAQANPGAGSESGNPGITTIIAPAIVLAQTAPVNTSRSNKKAGKATEGGSALEAVSTTRGRKLQSDKTGKAGIFDRWGNTPSAR